SNATSVIVSPSAMVSRRRAGAQTPSAGAGGAAATSGSVATSVMLAGPTHPAPTRFPMLTPLTAPHEREDALVRSLLTGIAVFRWLAWAVMGGRRGLPG